MSQPTSLIFAKTLRPKTRSDDVSTSDGSHLLVNKTKVRLLYLAGIMVFLVHIRSHMVYFRRVQTVIRDAEVPLNLKKPALPGED